MQRFLFLLLVCIVTVLTGCGTIHADESETQTGATNVQKSPDAPKILIAYYSLTGNTERAAQKIQQLTGGTLFRIEARDPYPREHDACLTRDEQEIQTNARPAVASQVPNM